MGAGIGYQGGLFLLLVYYYADKVWDLVLARSLITVTNTGEVPFFFKFIAYLETGLHKA